jgi:hypothetical protein
VATAASIEIQTWPIDRLVLYARNPRKKGASQEQYGYPLRIIKMRVRPYAIEHNVRLVILGHGQIRQF